MKLLQFQRFLKKNRIQTTFFVAPDPTITYFTQMEPSHGYLLITPKSAKLYISKLDKKPRLKNIKIKTLDKTFEKTITSKTTKKVGINKTSLTVQQLDKAKKIFPKAKFVDISKQLNALRKQKTAKELQLIAKACSITTSAFNALVKELPKKTLKTEQDVAFFLEGHIKSKGASLAFPTIAATHTNAATPHHITSTDTLKRGFLLVDFGARYKNYCADMTRCIFLGTPNEEQKMLYNLLLNAQTSAIKAIKPKISLKELDTTARNTLKKHAKYFIHSLGHGIGIEVHEDPFFSQPAKVEKNVPFTIEPGIYIKNKIGLRIEDTVVWTNKLTILTRAPKSLIIIKQF